MAQTIASHRRSYAQQRLGFLFDGDKSKLSFLTGPRWIWQSGLVAKICPMQR